MNSWLQRTLIVFFCLGVVCCALGQAPSLEGVENYLLYYGPVTEAEIADFQAYDLVVLDPQAIGENAAEKIAAIRSGGTLVMGYLSYFELAPWHRYRDRVPEAWRVRIDGEVWRPWGENDPIDLAIPEWRALLVELTRSEVMAYGCDGVFMDTLADLDHPELPPEVRQRQLEGLALLMAELRDAYAEFIFIGNWTLQETLPVMAPYVDVICWENFQPEFFEEGNPAHKFVSGIAERLEALRVRYGFRVAALWASQESDPVRQAEERRAMAECAEAVGYWWYYCLGDYHNGYLPK